MKLATLEEFTAELRAAGLGDKADIEVWWGRIVDGERWTRLKHRRKAALEDHPSGSNPGPTDTTET